MFFNNSCPGTEGYLNVCGKPVILKDQSYQLKYHHGMVSDQGLGKTSLEQSESASIKNLVILVDDNLGSHSYERGCSYSCPLSFTSKGFVYTTTQWEVLESEPDNVAGTVTVTIQSKFVKRDENGRLVGFTVLKI